MQLKGNLTHVTRFELGIRNDGEQKLQEARRPDTSDSKSGQWLYMIIIITAVLSDKPRVKGPGACDQ